MNWKFESREASRKLNSTQSRAEVAADVACSDAYVVFILNQLPEGRTSINMRICNRLQPAVLLHLSDLLRAEGLKGMANE